MNDDNKRFIKPEALLIVFSNDDIISISEYSTEDFLFDGDRERWYS